jgi:glycosyltransferase involved in cell wall biosynthesis
VVSYPLGAVASVVQDGRTGVVLARPDNELMAAAVVDLLRRPDTRAALGTEARARAGRFATAHAAEQYAAHLASLLATRQHDA